MDEPASSATETEGGCSSTHSWRCWHKLWFHTRFNSTGPLEKMTQWFLGGGSAPLAGDASSPGLHSERLLQLPRFFYFPVRCLANSASVSRDNPLAVSCVVNLFSSSVSSSRSFLSSSFLGLQFHLVLTATSLKVHNCRLECKGLSAVAEMLSSSISDRQIQSFYFGAQGNKPE